MFKLKCSHGQTILNDNWRKCISSLIGTTVKTAQTARSGSADRSSSHG